MARRKSTFEREMKSAAFRRVFEKEYSELLLSELVCAAMEEDEISVRKLAKAADLSPSVIQKIRTGAQKDVKVGNFLNIMRECGYSVVLEKNKRRIQLHP